MTTPIYCIFVCGTQIRKPKKDWRFLIINDGFYIAEEDLKLRGPGDCLVLDKAGI